MSILRNTLAVASTSLVGLVVRMGSLVVLARTLSPDDFGISAMAMAIVTIVSILTQLDLRDALIQRPQISRRHVVLALAGLCISAAAWVVVIVALAPHAERWTGIAGLAPVLAVSSVILLLDALTVVPEALLIRAHRAAVVGQSALAGLALGFTACSIAASLTGLGVWSLVIGYIAMSAVQLSLMTLRAGRGVRRVAIATPASGGVIATLRDLYRYSLLGSLNRLLNNANDNVGNLLVGTLAGSAPLGFYSRAHVLAIVPIETLLGMTIRSIAFPAFARLAHDREGLRKALRQTISSVSGLVAMIAGGICVLSPEIVALFLGGQWAQAVFPLQCLSAAMMFRFGPRLLEALSRALARLVPMVLTNVVTVAVFIGAIALGTWWRGVDGAALAVLGVVGLQWLAAQLLMAYLTGLSLRDMLAAHIRPVLLAGSFLVPLLLSAMLARGYGLAAPVVIVVSGAVATAIGASIVLVGARQILDAWQSDIALRLVDRLPGGRRVEGIRAWLRGRLLPVR